MSGRHCSSWLGDETVLVEMRMINRIQLLLCVSLRVTLGIAFPYGSDESENWKPRVKCAAGTSSSILRKKKKLPKWGWKFQNMQLKVLLWVTSVYVDDVFILLHTSEPHHKIHSPLQTYTHTHTCMQKHAGNQFVFLHKATLTAHTHTFTHTRSCQPVSL